MAIDFKNILSQLRKGITNLAENSLKEYVAAATADGQAILADLEDDLKTWTKQLAEGQISKDDFTDLVLGQAEELKLVALKQAGLGEVRADQFKNGVVNLITNTVTDLVP